MPAKKKAKKKKGVMSAIVAGKNIKKRKQKRQDIMKALFGNDQPPGKRQR